MTVIDAPPPAPGPPPAAPPSRRLPRVDLTKVGRVRVPRKRIVHSDGSVVINWIMATAVLLVGWTLLYGLAISSLQHAHDQSVLYGQLRQELALDTAPLGGMIKPGSPVAVLDIPAIGMKQQVVVEGTTSGQLAMGPGHLRNTPLPGQPGVSVLYGRAKLFGGPFHSITSLRPGERITTTTGEGISTYVVQRIRHAGDPLPAVATGSGRLTLVTAENGGWQSAWAPSRAVFVDASLVSTPLVDPGGRVSTVPKSERALQGDSNALFVLVLWLPLLLLAALGIVWGRERWGGWQTWIVGVPVVLTALWGVTETAARFLPNLM